VKSRRLAGEIALSLKWSLQGNPAPLLFISLYTNENFERKETQ
jgi:hypothetical protein